MQYIDVSPEEVVINYENKQFSPCYLTITNTFYQRITFKVNTMINDYQIKATNPDLFTVKPNRGLIEPQGNIQIEIQGHSDVYNTNLYNPHNSNYKTCPVFLVRSF